MNKNILLLVVIPLLAGCLKFGENISLSGEEIDSQVIEHVTQLTGVIFPEGVVGQEYFYFGDSIDPALRMKVTIPGERKEEFLQNRIFTEGRGHDEGHGMTWMRHDDWWNVQSLKDPVYTIYAYPNGAAIECYVGEESGETVVYLAWMTV